MQVPLVSILSATGAWSGQTEHSCFLLIISRFEHEGLEHLNYLSFDLGLLTYKVHCDEYIVSQEH